MKALKLLLRGEGIDAGGLRVLFEQDGVPTFALTVDGDGAVNLWERLAALAPRAGRWPLLLDPERDDGQLPDTMDGRPVADILQEAAALDGRALLDGWHEARLKHLLADAQRHEAEGATDDARYFRARLKGPKEFRGVPRGDWPGDALPTSPFNIGRRITHGRAGSRPVTLALLPSAHGWEAAAHLRLGGWNANPRPAEHVAVHRYWHEHYGARLVTAKSDTLEMMVERPPRTRKEAMRLGRDQYHYCEDIVEQGTRTLENLAGGLLAGEAWYFWWD